MLVWIGVGDDVRFFNRTWHDYTGLAEPHSRDGDWRQVVHADDIPRCDTAFADAAQHHESHDVELRLRRHDGVYRRHRVRFAVPPLGVPAALWLGTAVDIEPHRQAEAERAALLAREHAARLEAEKANRQKDQFLAAVSHELRAPLTTLLLWEKVLQGDPNPDLRQRALDAIRLSAMAQSRLVDDLLDVSRAISGKLRIDSRPLSIPGLVQMAADAVRPAMAERQLTLNVVVSPRVGEVRGDANRLLQVLSNLLSNAIKFTEPGGRVTVTAQATGNGVEIHVADTGRGIAPEFLPHVFEPFRQTEDRQAGTHGGLGLGLAIARQLVALHGGTLTARSPGRTLGSTFTITLPHRAERDRARTPPHGAPETGRLRGVRVLVVDDDPDVCDALAHLLDKEEAAVVCATSAATGWTSLIADPPTVLVSDLAMPGEDGAQFVERIRRHPSSAVREVPAIALTAHATEADRRRVIAAGFDVHIGKPIDLEHLIETIAAMVALPRT